jgi:hypothetical protein
MWSIEPRDGSASLSSASSNHMKTSRCLDPARRAVSTAREGRVRSQVPTRRLPSSKRAVSILQLWCILNVCTSIVDLHWDHRGEHGKESEEGKEGKEDSQEEKEVIDETS